MIRKITLSLSIIILGMSMLEAKSVLSKSSVNYPRWLKSKRCKLDKKYPGKLWKLGRVNENIMKVDAGKLLFLIDKYPKSPTRPFLMFQLASHLINLNEHKAAKEILKKIQKLPARTPYKWKYRLKTLPQLKREVSFMQMKCAAKSKKTKEALKRAKQLKAKNGHENLRLAETYVLLGEYKKAVPYLEKSKGTGHWDRGFSDEYLRMYAATLARAIGENDLAVKISKPVLKKGLKAKKGSQWKAAYSILKKLNENIKNKKITANQLKKKFKEGRFTGECRGFVAPITVNTYFDKKGFKKIYVVKNRENRSWSAIKIIPKRISDAKSLGVDAITGATVSSCAIIVATDNAAVKAAIKEE
jgi:uncharacterized protein with FMN-binding domain